MSGAWRRDIGSGRYRKKKKKIKFSLSRIKSCSLFDLLVKNQLSHPSKKKKLNKNLAMVAASFLTFYFT